MVLAAQRVFASAAQMKTRATTSPTLLSTMALAITSTSVVCVVVMAFCRVNAIAKATLSTNAACVGAQAFPKEHAIAKAMSWINVTFAEARARLAWGALTLRAQVTILSPPLTMDLVLLGGV